MMLLLYFLVMASTRVYGQQPLVIGIGGLDNQFEHCLGEICIIMLACLSPYFIAYWICTYSTYEGSLTKDNFHHKYLLNSC